MVIICKQVLPPINCNCVKPGPMLGVAGHHTNLRELQQLFSAMSLVGDKATAAYGFKCWLAGELGTPPRAKRSER